MTPFDKERYARQTSLPEFGPGGQERLLSSSCLVIGAGGLGSPAILYLAAAGVGHIGIADGDRVSVSNLQRQIIHNEKILNELKVKSAARVVQNLNSGVNIEIWPYFVDSLNINGLIDRYDFVIDATDDPGAKFLINDMCVKTGKPYCHGAIEGVRGQLMTVLPGTADLRSLFDAEPVRDAVPRGPIGILPGVIGTLQAGEAIKFLSGTGELLVNALLTFDAMTSRFRRIEI